MKRVALCFTGHTRDFIQCYENILNNFITPLTNNNCHIDYFCSFWDSKGNRELNWEGNVRFDSIIELIKPKALLIEKFNRSLFIENYNTEKWREYSHLSDRTTCGDSVSMWYKIQTCLTLIKQYESISKNKYDIIVRIRPDIIFNNIFDVSILSDIFENDVLYIPKWHEKYFEISKTITDYFAIGNYSVMEQYMSVFNNIDNLISCDSYSHTGEGFLYEQTKNLNIKRLDNTSFSLKRANYIEHIV